MSIPKELPILIGGASLLVGLILGIRENNKKVRRVKVEKDERDIDSFFMHEELEAYRYFLRTDRPSPCDGVFDDGMKVAERVRQCESMGFEWSPEMQSMISDASFRNMVDSKIRRRTQKAEKAKKNAA